MIRINALAIAAALVLLGGAAVTAWPCDIPVFIYAMDNWQSDPYNVFVFREGPLTPDEQEALKTLEAAGELDATAPANIVVHDTDLSGEVPGPVRAIWKAAGTDATPLVALCYPFVVPYREPIWTGPLDKDTVDTLAASSLRRTVAAELLRGAVGAWVLLESGNAEKDSAAAALVKAKSAEAAKTIDEHPEFGPEKLVENPFPLFRLKRDDPGETLLRHMLLNSEPGLTDYADEPMAFPIYGRGRALYALVGAGINEMNVMDACMFLVGDCSCVVKDLNPGTDLLMAVDWEEAVLPPLPPPPSEPPPEAQLPEAEEAPIVLTAAVALGVALVVVVGVTAAAIRARNREV